MGRFEAKSIGPIAFFVLGVITLIIGAASKSANPTFDPSGFYYATVILFLFGAFLVIKNKSAGSFHWKM